jgi:hypothetical protein
LQLADLLLSDETLLAIGFLLSSGFRSGWGELFLEKGKGKEERSEANAAKGYRHSEEGYRESASMSMARRSLLP